MKLEIESVSNGYIITIPKDEYTEIEGKYVVEMIDKDFSDDNRDEFKAFSELVSQLQEFFGVSNTKHNRIGYINGLCSEDKRWEVMEMMEKSLANPKNDLGDD